MQAYVVHPDPANERAAAIVRLVQKLGHGASLVRDWNEAQTGQGYGRDVKLIIVPDDSAGTIRAEEAVRHLSSVTGGLFLVYVADAIAPEIYKQLVKTGRGEWIAWKALVQELPDLIAKLSQSAEEGGSARVVSFLPSAGGVGNTTLALEVGYCLGSGRKKKDTRVAVVDLNFQASSLADLLDLQPRLDVSEIIDRPDRLDDRLIDIFTSHYSPSLDVFSSPTRFDSREVASAEVVFALLDGLSKRYDFILADLPHHWSPWADNVLLGSDAIVITGGSTVPAVKQLTTRLQYINFLSIPSERTRVAINQCEVSLLGTVSRKADIERALSNGNPIYLPRDVSTAEQAANTGRPMMDLASRRPISKSIHRLAEWVRTATDGAANAPK